jgi:hypothetical protein
MRRLLTALLLGLAAGAMAQTHETPAAAAPSLTLEGIQAEVRARNPQLRAAVALAAADRERITQAGSREDAVAGLELMRDSSRRITTYAAPSPPLKPASHPPGCARGSSCC